MERTLYSASTGGVILPATIIYLRTVQVKRSSLANTDPVIPILTDIALIHGLKIETDIN